MYFFLLYIVLLYKFFNGFVRPYKANDFQINSLDCGRLIVINLF